jgi:hypothetical protein
MLGDLYAINFQQAVAGARLAAWSLVMVRHLKRVEANASTS